MNIEPCMFCDSNDGPCITYYSTGIKRVECFCCGAAGPDRKDDEGAITAWNEIARIVRDAREPNDDCDVCNGTGYIVDINPFMGSQSKCYKCNGTGKI